jgi:hypothetical protein
MRFDLSQIVPGSLTAARLDLTAASAINGTHDLMIYGLVQDASGWDWNESTVTFSDAPGLVFDGNSQTLGVNNTFTTTNHPDNPDVLNLGQVTIEATAAGTTVSLTNPKLAVFLNLAAYYQGEASQDVVTIILQQVGNASPANFWSKEGNAVLAPRLVVNALLDPPNLAGDYNDDGVVSAADYVVWRKGGLPQADGDGDGMFNNDIDDRAEWQENFGATAPVPGGALQATVPEPMGWNWPILAATMAWQYRRTRLRVFGRFLQE